MDAHSFHDPSTTCPLCGQGKETPQNWRHHVGLLTCRRCRERLVVSWSGHYVRDPFILKHLMRGKTLRRQSRPLARILRDCGIVRRAPFLAAIGGAAIAFGMVFLTSSQREIQPEQQQPNWPQITDTFPSIGNPGDQPSP